MHPRIRAVLHCVQAPQYAEELAAFSPFQPQSACPVTEKVSEVNAAKVDVKLLGEPRERCTFGSLETVINNLPHTSNNAFNSSAEA